MCQYRAAQAPGVAGESAAALAHYGASFAMKPGLFPPFASTRMARPVDTGNADRDASLCSEGFFDAKKFPIIFFQSRKVESIGETTYRIVGDLTIREVTKEIVLDAELGGFVTDLNGARRAGFSVQCSLMRSDFGIVWNQTLEAGGVAISDRVDLHAEIEAVVQAALAA
jgi:polyisoprenoid-binding protein YceI